MDMAGSNGFTLAQRRFRTDIKETLPWDAGIGDRAVPEYTAWKVTDFKSLEVKSSCGAE